MKLGSSFACDFIKGTTLRLGDSPLRGYLESRDSWSLFIT